MIARPVNNSRHAALQRRKAQSTNGGSSQPSTVTKQYYCREVLQILRHKSATQPCSSHIRYEVESVLTGSEKYSYFTPVQGL